MKSFLEGRMVVLSLVLGLSEQDDFANIPDLQNPGTQQNQNAQGDKRYELGRRRQRRRRRQRAACLGHPAAGPGGGAFRGCWSRRPASPAGTLTRGHPGGVPGSEASAAGRPGTILDQACSPGMPALARSKPAFLPILPLAPRCPSSSISPGPEIPFPRGLVGGGDVREGAPPVLPHPRHLNLPFSWSDGPPNTLLQRCGRLLC